MNFEAIVRIEFSTVSTDMSGGEQVSKTIIQRCADAHWMVEGKVYPRHLRAMTAIEDILKTMPIEPRHKEEESGGNK